MIKFCPNCGNELKSDFKFCPSCGFDLTKINNKTSEHEVIECEHCGTENLLGTEVCKSCGIKLKGEKKKSSEPVLEQVSRKELKTKKVQPPVVNSEVKKEIDSKKILGILVGVLAVCFVILFVAGVFDKPSIPTTTGNVNQNTNSGVDLSALQKINELEATIKANPNNNQALLELAHLRNDSGMFEKAIENYQEYLSKVPEDAEARIDMGVCYYNLGNYNEAIASMTKALEYNPNHQIGHLNLGIVNLAAGNMDKSKEWLQKAVALGPNTDVGKRAQELLNSH